MISQLRHNFQASEAVYGDDDITTQTFIEPGQFYERLWSPNWYSYLLQQAGVPNLILFALDIGYVCASTAQAQAPHQDPDGIDSEAH